LDILRAAFEPIFFLEKNKYTNCKWRKAAQNTFEQKSASKMLVKLIRSDRSRIENVNGKARLRLIKL